MPSSKQIFTNEEDFRDQKLEIYHYIYFFMAFWPLLSSSSPKKKHTIFDVPKPTPLIFPTVQCLVRILSD